MKSFGNVVSSNTQNYDLNMCPYLHRGVVFMLDEPTPQFYHRVMCLRYGIVVQGRSRRKGDTVRARIRVGKASNVRLHVGGSLFLHLTMHTLGDIVVVLPQRAVGAWQSVMYTQFCSSARRTI